jgi:hypothetical protein
MAVRIGHWNADAAVALVAWAELSGRFHEHGIKGDGHDPDRVIALARDVLAMGGLVTGRAAGNPERRKHK